MNPIANMSQQHIQGIKAVFNAPPENFPSGASTGAAVIGNGDVLVAIGGTADTLTFSLSKVDFWQAREEAGRGGGVKAVGTLCLNAPALEGASYALEQHIHDATVRGHFEKDGAAMSVKTWTPRGQNALVVELEASGSSAITIQPVFHIQDGSDSVIESGQEDGVDWHERRFEEEYLFWKSGITVAMRTVPDGALILEPGQKHTLVLALATNFDSPDHRKSALHLARALDDKRLAEARTAHESWWSALWQKCARVQIGDDYLEDRYYGSHYILAACCGNKNFPPGLWGWITNDYPGWGGDYHANYNFEAPWWGVLTSNLVELADPYDQPILDYLPRMKAYAKRFLNVRGAYCNVGFGPKGVHVDLAATPYDDGHNFHGQKSNASFLACNMIMRYYLTHDLDYARRCAYPFLVEVMNFWEDYLSFEDGRYVSRNDCVNECSFFVMLPPDSREFERARDKNPPLSLGLIRMVCRAAIEISEALGLDEPRREKWQHILDHISDFPLTERDGKPMFDVCENGETKLEEVNMCGIQHIYPAGAISLSSDPRLIRAALNTILYKDLWEQGNSFSTVFAAAARVGVDADLILQQMKRVTKKYIQPNFLFNMGGGGIENNSGIPDGLNEMLLQSHEGLLRLFPCWPGNRPARFDRIRAYGAFLVSAELADGEVQCVHIVSEKGQACTVQNPWPAEVQVTRNGQQSETVTGKRFTLATTPGECIQLAMTRGVYTPHGR